MRVQRILDRKGRNVVAARPNTSIRDIVTMLAEKRIGAVVITEAGDRIAGIVSERDVVRALAGKGHVAMDDDATAIMTRSVVTCRAEDRVADIMRVMTDGKFRHVPVVDATSRLIGIVSIGDVVKHRLNELEAEANALRDYIIAT
jgi:CBS domain-containing protein